MQKEITMHEGIERILRGEQGIRLIISQSLGPETKLGEITRAIECGAICVMEVDDNVCDAAPDPHPQKNGSTVEK